MRSDCVAVGDETGRASWWQTGVWHMWKLPWGDTRQLVRHSHADLWSRIFSGTVCRCEDASSAPERSSSIKRRVSVSIDAAHVTRGHERRDCETIGETFSRSAARSGHLRDLAGRDDLLIKSSSGYIFVSNRDIISWRVSTWLIVLHYYYYCLSVLFNCSRAI